MALETLTLVLLELQTLAVAAEVHHTAQLALMVVQE
jgi:hypothetical protein